MYHKPNKRQQQIKLILIYSLMITVIVGIVSILVLLIQGYRFDQIDGKIERDGLVQFDSSPGSAIVGVDGQNISDTTPARLTIDAGTHHFAMTKNGYRPWEKTEELRGGSILWLNYARLVPEELTIKSVANFAALSSALASPNDEWMATVPAATTLQIELYNIRDDTVERKPLAVTATDITKTDAAQRFTLERWSSDSRYLIVKHSFDKKTEWLVVDTQDNTNNVVNINRLLGISPGRVEFRPGNARQLYILEQGNLRRADLGARTLTGPIARTVNTFSVADDGLVVFTTLLDETTDVRSIGYVSDGASRSQVLRTFTNLGDEPLLVASGQYFGERYLTLVVGQKMEIMHAELADSNDKNGKSSLQLLTSQQLPTNEALRVDVRTKGRFSIVQFKDAYVTYDLELQKFSTTPLTGKSSARPLMWLDAYIVWRDTDAKLKLYEFDGQNVQSIVPTVPGYDVTLSPNGEYLYLVTKSDDGRLQLSQVRMILN